VYRVFGGCRQSWGMFYYFWLFFYDVITRTMSRNCGSKFGLGCDMNLWRTRSTSCRFWCQSYGQKTGNLVL